MITQLFRNFDIYLQNVERPWIERGDFILKDFGVIVVPRNK